MTPNKGKAGERPGAPPAPKLEQVPLSDAQILKLLPIGWAGSAVHILQLARAVEAQHGIIDKESKDAVQAN